MQEIELFQDLGLLKYTAVTICIQVGHIPKAIILSSKL
jgi:hypothetical protein